ncbi:enhanced serine sensitivity protein SseB C-terminal domain-containing protein [Variovorax sp. GB1P17]|uniref:enhanced serine sensitivity protein SseB C-terminal domain-containing protein n=1 Tax=Variovorax sp. GB1P17 TaxID=3443740 RepID=UPI003F456197
MAYSFLNVTIPAGTHIRIGVPAEQPDEAIARLTSLFEARPHVQRAQLGLMEVRPSEGEPYFTYVIGWHTTDGEPHADEREVLNALEGVPAGRWPISIAPITETFFTDEAIVFYARRSEPVRARKAGFFASLFGKTRAS